MRDEKLKTMVKTGLFMAIIFVFTYTFKIPVSLTGGYTHLGDAAIFLAVMLLGRKNGTIAFGMCSFWLRPYFSGWGFIWRFISEYGMVCDHLEKMGVETSAFRLLF